MDPRTIARLRGLRPARMSFRLTALDIEQHRARVAIGVRCPGCGLLYLTGDASQDPETKLDAEIEARARLYVACPDHAYRFVIGGDGPSMGGHAP